MRIMRIAGQCHGILTGSSVGLAVRSKHVKMLLKPGNTKGDAVVGYVVKFLGCRKRVRMGNLRGGSVRTGGVVKCVPRVPSLCPGLAISRRVRFVTQTCGLGSCGTCGSTLLRQFSLASGGGGFKSRLSGKVRRGLSVYYKLLPGPQLMLFSRPVVKLSPRTVGRLGGIFRRLQSDNYVMLIDARVVSDVRRL